MTKRTRLFMSGAALLWALACHTNVRSTDGNTSWLHHCRSAADCDGTSCECGVCTDRCTSDEMCPAPDSVCAKTGSSALTLTCGTDSVLTGICLPACPREGCGAGHVCTDGLCTPAAPSRAAVDGGFTDGAGGRPGSDAAPPVSVGTSFGGATNAMSTTGPSLDCSMIDYPALRGGPAVSLRNDLLPIFGRACVFSDCHGPSDHKAALNLGNKCNYDANAKWLCTFPSAADPNNPTAPQPDSEALIEQMYSGLLAPSVTVNGGTVMRVVPGDPANSFLVLKLADQQNSRGYQCANQDPSHESSPPPCGVSMPQNQDRFCEGTNRPIFDAIVRWVWQGALDN